MKMRALITKISLCKEESSVYLQILNLLNLIAMLIKPSLLNKNPKGKK